MSASIELHNLSVEMRAILEMAEENGGELTPEMEAHFAAMEGTAEDVVEQMALACRELALSADAIKLEVDRLQKREKSRRGMEDFLRGCIVAHMSSVGVDRVKTDLVTVPLMEGKVKYVWDGKEENIPFFCRRTLTEHRLDQDAVRRFADETGSLPEGMRAVQKKFIKIL